ncbi:MAG: multifunctional oxoglutarate decarboxylase/oxoglutarate dehydrogenase thiamine pyrophosphate-binding subunit/dihydrolipoyllysine-residue succinyltransferase subunit [Candidatus Nanopelagicales bacterium]|nr:multifunctional oxoglutarate decarboxylase/oxoglutarate dehydrogenase thiamine pyrophosphate-binding subunit/dihydrolipoyllysine-residue succinyltransferase subunit [Candidatus Nanopelagicales bacterium]
MADAPTSTDAPLDPMPPPDSFGPNEWLVDEIHERYVADRNSVDPAWWEFFADYRPARDTAPAEAAHTAASSEAAVRSAGAGGGGAAADTIATSPIDVRASTQPAETATEAGHPTPIRGTAARVVANMEASLAIPTATSVRTVPAKLLIDNRMVINNHLRRSKGGKISFTHLIGWAVVRTLSEMPGMNAAFTERAGKPTLLMPDHVNLGIAIDLAKSDGSRQLLVPSIKAAETLDFRAFWTTYEDLIRRARTSRLTVTDFADTTTTITNPGTIGTVSSVPRLMPGQGVIVGVGAMDYPAEFQGAAPATLAAQGVSKVVTLTSTYDHRIIQGAQSGGFLRRINALLLGEDGFYDEIFAALRIPYEPVRWALDIAHTHDDQVSKTARVQQLIHAYRVRGHLMADIDPLECRQRSHPDLDISNHGLTLWDLEREFATGGFGGRPFMTLRDILGMLRDSYCRTVGAEYMHIQDPEQRAWIQERVEHQHDSAPREEHLRILRRLNSAEAFETFLQTKYVGQKRFSLEGAETAIPILDRIASAAADASLDEVCIGMPHRGRLNVLANLAGKSYAQIFREFEGAIDVESVQGSGDVKYHLGCSGTFTAPSSAQCRVYVAANPSHLEAVDPVLEGIARAKQDILDRSEEFPVLPVLLHGDAAFAGQGVVAETLNLSQLRGYRTGGTIHLVINNQVGFTTPPSSSRSSVYATDAARMVQAPIFHLNGDDPETCVRIAQLAFEFRQEFKKDVVIDMVCYRKRGHNEADDPSLTQPLMYKVIDEQRSVRKLYTESLIGRGDITVEDAEQALKDYQAQLERVFTETREEAARASMATEVDEPIAPLDEDCDTRPGDQSAAIDLTRSRLTRPVDTTISDEMIKRIVASQIELPEELSVHPRLLPQLQRRAQMIEDGTIDWAMGETLAIGSLLLEGHPVRLTGQDSRRGTFGQRHAVVVDRFTGAEFTPLKNMAPDQGKYYVHDSLLSEFAAMGFEYGYSVARPEALVIWEAQFGDFANGAQTILDEFLSSGEQKWSQRSSVVLLLPHGYEGQGPDHSSGRPERFLQMAAQDNMIVAMPSTPASYFHLLRRQILAAPQVPLIVFTPKSMLRLKAASSQASDFTDIAFRPVIGDETVDPNRVKRVLLCTGKITWDLRAARQEAGRNDVAIVRLEQLYPLPTEELRAELDRYPADAEFWWVQEEPENQGAWTYLLLNLVPHLDRVLMSATRPASASPATGSHRVHAWEQADLMSRALG